jgi:hypothetical protein
VSAEETASRDSRYGSLTQVILSNEEDRQRIQRLRIEGLTLAGVLLILPVLLWTPVHGNPGASEFFRNPTPHEGYFLEMARAGSGGTALGRAWLDAAFRALDENVVVRGSYEERGALASDEPHAWGFRVRLERGQRLAVGLAFEAPDSPRVFVDLHRAAPLTERRPVPLLGSEVAESAWAFESTRREDYVIRLQPEMDWQGPFELILRVEPSFRFPVAGRGMEDVGGVFGDPRDGGRREHHGIDIFAPRGTPVLAAADGRILAANTNTLGGRVVWQQTADGKHTLYYAHLTRALVGDGQRVTAGDTIGLVGNTGNARTTPPHLHFGVYARGEGAVDPWYFIAPVPSGIPYGRPSPAAAPLPTPVVAPRERIQGPMPSFSLMAASICGANRASSAWAVILRM